MRSDNIYDENMASAIEGYLVHRFPGATLQWLQVATIMNEHDSDMVRALFNWREEADWKSPGVLGARRCANCTKVMREDESSAAVDEEICAKCGGAK